MSVLLARLGRDKKGPITIDTVWLAEKALNRINLRRCEWARRTGVFGGQMRFQHSTINLRGRRSFRAFLNDRLRRSSWPIKSTLPAKIFFSAPGFDCPRGMGTKPSASWREECAAAALSPPSPFYNLRRPPPCPVPHRPTIRKLISLYPPKICAERQECNKQRSYQECQEQ